MQKDVYAIYESYILNEDGYSKSPRSSVLPGSNPIDASANYTNRSNLPNGGIGVKGAFGDSTSNSNISASGTPAQAEETPVHKKIKKDIDTLLKHINSKNYGHAKVYCDQISKSIQLAHEEAEKKNKK
jgi:hypothetical protein